MGRRAFLEVELCSIAVEAHAGYKADQYPKRVRLAGEWREVVEVTDRWYEPGADYFKILAGDGNTYILRRRYGHEVSLWELMAYRQGW